MIYFIVLFCFSVSQKTQLCVKFYRNISMSTKTYGHYICYWFVLFKFVSFCLIWKPKTIPINGMSYVLYIHTRIICIFNTVKCPQTVFNNSYTIPPFLPMVCKSRVLLTSWYQILNLQMHLGRNGIFITLTLLIFGYNTQC